MLNVRAAYQAVAVRDKIIFIIDDDGPVSITNDAEAVVAAVNRAWPNYRIVYRDTEGQWDELSHINGSFTGYLPYHGWTP